MLTLLEENRQPEIGGLERRVLILVEQKEVLGLEVPVYDPHGMARVHDLDDRPEQRGRSPLRVMPLGDDPVKQLSPGA